MAVKLTRLTQKITIQLHLMAESLPFTVLAPGGQSGNFWIHSYILCYMICESFRLSLFFGTFHIDAIFPDGLHLVQVK
jgi:hypothetical protein